MKVKYRILFLFLLLCLATFGFLTGSPERLENEMAGKHQEKSQSPKPEVFNINDTEVMITQIDAREVVMINGCIEPYYKTEGGYLLKRDVYQKPSKSLRTAVERYLKAEAAR